ncbi:CCA tRNA nucleotidyltransferase [Xanthobacter dioxanivorans]|uniref:CCA tRNA nucleotidyltransferase n=1 Tax=Xanthobacter dioxanivorans TaxID=2528964 RepID=A0A974SL21_9HYPH|nr:CCA tRNA nucleotidyltransferase [Xanthobacter dioxanivorans]QRG08829.1 CCA tRNA nucleotidyltransferase [Xanthobacter dioxanivorans]
MTSSIAGAAFWATPGLAEVLGLLNAGDEEARVVGGAVRNSLLNLPVIDVDIATTALPQEVVERARRAGMKPVPTGIAHGTVTVVAGHHAFEVTTLREDMETDGRRAVVRFGRDWRHDAERRDFTLNALYATADGTVVDLVGGLSDLAARRVRFIGDAQARIREDYLRILRLFRFHASYGVGEVDPTALSAAVRLRAGLLGLSRERIRAETMKLLVAPGAAPTLATMSESGLLQMLLGGIGDVKAFARLAGLEASLGLRPDPTRRLAALALRVSVDVERLRAHLRLSNAETRRLFALAGPVPPLPDVQSVKAFLYAGGVEAGRDRVLLAAAHGRCDPAAAARVVEAAATWDLPRPPFTAADLIARGLKPGPGLGAALRWAEQAWIDAGFPTGEPAVSALLEKAARQG